MGLKKLTLLATEEHRGLRLDQVLALWLPKALSREISKAKVRKLIVAGAVYLNGRRVRIASKTILPRALVEAFVDIQKLEQNATSQDRVFVMTEQSVLFEDDYLIAVNKPPGLPTQPTLDDSRDNLYAAVKKYLSVRDKAAEPYVGLHHRLDRDTSGVVLFTKDKSVNVAVANGFSEHEIEKTYWALTSIGPTAETQWSVKNYLAKDKSSRNKSARFCSVRSGGDFAHTDFRILETLKAGLLIEAKPRTGRTHQIRVHLSEAGLPILGDRHYGGDSSRATRVMLHAVRLNWVHPITKLALSIESPLPEDFVQCKNKL